MGKTFKKNRVLDKTSDSTKKDKTAKYKYHFHMEVDDSLLDEETYDWDKADEIDSEADSCLFNENGTRKTEEQLNKEREELEQKIKRLDNPTK